MNWGRVRRARALARGLLCVAVAVPVLLWIASPLFTDGLRSGGPRVQSFAGLSMGDLPSVIGIAGVIFGLAWMWRLYKAPTKHDGALWRYRDR